MAVSTASTHGSLVALQQPLLLQDLMHDTTFDIGQTEIAAAVAVGQAGRAREDTPGHRMPFVPRVTDHPQALMLEWLWRNHRGARQARRSQHLFDVSKM